MKKLLETREFDVLKKSFHIETHQKKSVRGEVVFIEHADTAVCVYFNERKECLLLNQYRPIFNQWFIELPGGLVKDGETPRRAAIREFREEVGFTPSRLKKIVTVIPTIGLSTERIHIFQVTSLSNVDRPHFASDEAIEILWLRKRDLLTKLKAGKIVDAKTVIGILATLKGIQFSNLL